MWRTLLRYVRFSFEFAWIVYYTHPIEVFVQKLIKSGAMNCGLSQQYRSRPCRLHCWWNGYIIDDVITSCKFTQETKSAQVTTDFNNNATSSAKLASLCEVSTSDASLDRNFWCELYRTDSDYVGVRTRSFLLRGGGEADIRRQWRCASTAQR